MEGPLQLVLGVGGWVREGERVSERVRDRERGWDGAGVRGRVGEWASGRAGERASGRAPRVSI